MAKDVEAECTRVLLCDPNHLMRVGLASVLQREPDIAVVGEARHAREVEGAVRELRPHVALISHDPDLMDGIAVAKILRKMGRATAPGVLMLSSATEDDEILAALRGGVRGLLPGNCDPQSLPAAIRDIADGAMVLKSPSAVQLIRLLLNRAPEMAPATASQLSLLTSRERDVLELVASGHPNLVIARTLSLSEATVKSHLYHLCQKLGLRDRTQAVILAYETGLVRASAA